MDTIYALLIVFVLYCIVSDWFMHEYGEKLNGNNFYKFKIGSFFSYQIPALKRLISLNDENLAKQPIFWILTVLPLMIAGWIEYKIVLLNPDLLSFENIEQLFKNSAPALYISALTPTLGVLISNIHRTIQTKKQIQVTEVKNISDGFYAHNKYIIEELKSISGSKEGFELKLSMRFPNLLYKDVYKNSNIKDGAAYKIDKEFFLNLNSKLCILSEQLHQLVNYLNNKKENEDKLHIFSITCKFSFISNNFDELMSYLHISYISENLINEWREICEKFDKHEDDNLGSLMHSFITDVPYFYSCEKINDSLQYLLNFFVITINFVDKIVDILNIPRLEGLEQLRKIVIFELFDLTQEWNAKCKNISSDYSEYMYEIQLAQERQGY